MQLKDMIHNQTAVPICRIHVYQGKKNFQNESYEDVLPPVHWAGKNPPGPPEKRQKPTCVLGKDGLYINENDLEFGKLAKNKQRTNWHVLSARVNLTRQWACSSAQFQLAHEDDQLAIATKSLNRPPVRPNDIIVIEMGYVKSLTTRINTAEGNTDYANFAGDVVFYGMVDTIKERGGSGENDGIVYTVLARDMMSFLVDNKIRGHYRPGSTKNFNRAYIVRDLIYRGAAVEYAESVYNKSKKTKEYKRDSKSGLYQEKSYGPQNSYLRIGILEASQREDPMPELPGVEQPGIVLMDRFPLDLIKHFSQVETAPRELFADNKTGEIHWLFRRTDMRKFFSKGDTENPERKSRQYFYRYPKNRANIISYTNEWSSAGVISHFSISNPIPQDGKANTKDFYAESPVGRLVDPHTGYNLRKITRNRFVYDDTMSQTIDAESIANALFLIWGRAITTGMVMVPGDPTIEIGEAIQLFNTGFFGRQFNEANKESSKDLVTQTTKEDVQDKTISVYKDTLLSPLNDKENVGTPNPDGYFRVEAVSHMFAMGGVSRGFTSVFVLGPIDSDTGSPSRIIKSETDKNAIKSIDLSLFPNTLSSEEPEGETPETPAKPSTPEGVRPSGGKQDDAYNQKFYA